MSRAPNSLQAALRLCESDKVKDRSEGIDAIRTFFSNKENFAIFQDTAKRDGGGGWIAFFQCLFQVVVLEKKALLKKSANAQTERRLADAISLVRFMAERSVHLISRKALSALVTHMSSLLVYSSAIFPPAALDYSKALRTLLSYPPHLEHLEPRAWRVLIGICWSAILGDPVSIEDEWEEDADEEMADPSPASGTPATQMVRTFSKGRTNTQTTTELALLIPVLLSSPSAPLLSPVPTSSQLYVYEQSLGLSILLKIQRFFTQFSTETSSHLPALRSMNIVLAVLELNCRSDFVASALKLLPPLISAWSFRNKAMREQVLIGLRMILPFLTHKTTRDKDRTGIVKSSLDRLMGVLGKESTIRGGILPLDLACVRLTSPLKSKEVSPVCPYETRCFTAGQDFDHDCALRWAALELYCETCYFLEEVSDPVPPSTPSKGDGTQAKRRKQAVTPVRALVAAASLGSLNARLQSLQVLIFIIDRHWSDLDLSTRSEIRDKLVTLLEEDEVPLQSWAFVGISVLASLEPATIRPNMTDAASASLTRADQSEEHDFGRAWQYAMRKISLAGVSRAACHAATCLLAQTKVPALTAARDLGALLQSVDIQGPPYPFDSVCALLVQALKIARQEVALYSMKLEDRVTSWFIKWNALEGIRGKNRLDPQSPAELAELLATICHFRLPFIPKPSTSGFLPDCAIVDRVVEETFTEPIRLFTLYGKIVDNNGLQVSGHGAQPAADNDSWTFLEGRPKRVSDSLDSLLRIFVADWPTNNSSLGPRPAIPPERCRRTIDLIVLALLFQGTLQVNGVRPDGVCLGNVVALLESVASALHSSTYDVPAQHMIWKGFEPLISAPPRTYSLWPILLKPNVLSGIRQDLLPRSGDEDEVSGESSEHEQLLAVIWSLSGVGSALKALFESALELFAGTETVHMPSGTPFGPIPAQDDDDFGEIRTAESDAMPISQEAVECHRTTSSLLSTLARFRLRGSLLLSANRLPSKDNALINAFLSSEGQRMVQLGTVICESVRDGLLRLSVEAVNLILSSLDDMHRSYAYTRDQGLLQLMLTFMTVSAPLWLSVDRTSSSLADDVIILAKSLYRKSTVGQVPSWRVRIALIVFIDEYLDYDPDQTVWRAASESQNAEGSNLVASDIVSAGLMDVDIHVRMRAASSTAGILYLSSMPFDQHFPFYTDLVNVLPREPRHWDSFITDILWKLNCCVSSPQLRAATIYHLYEIPPSTDDFNPHLQTGLETVSRRLGLDGIAPLFLAYAPLIISSQVVTSQSPMRVPHRLYGFTSRKAFALHTLEVAASSVLLYALAERHRTDNEARQYTGASETFAALCSAAGLEQNGVGVKHLSATAARALCDPNSGLYADFTSFERASVLQRLLSVPGVGEKDAASVVGAVAEDIATHIFALLDLDASDDDIIALLDKRSGKSKLGSAIYNALIPPQQKHISAPALVPNASLSDVLDGIDFLTETYPSMSAAKILFNTLSRLFHRVNEAFLVSEQYRHLRGVALVISLYAENLTHPAILGFLLRETIPLLCIADVSHTALSILEWGFDRISQALQAPSDIGQLVISLGDIRETLATLTTDQQDAKGGMTILKDYDKWILQAAPVWQAVPTMEDALSVAKSTWPRHLASALTEISPPSFKRLCEDTHKVRTTDILPVCGAMMRTMRTDPSGAEDDFRTFREHAFWDIKDRLHSSARSNDDASAFLDLLYLGNGAVQAPTPDSIGITDNDILADLRGRPPNDASPHLRAALIDRVAMLTHSADYKARSKALTVLQGLLPYAADDATGRLVPRATKDLMALLSPSADTAPSAAPKALSALLDDDTWLRRSRDPAQWSASFATMLCGAIAVSDPFYAILPTLFDAVPNAARDLLPLLVQSLLSLPDQKKPPQELQDRYKALSSHFTQVLKYPDASKDTLRAIVDIMLHLRRYTPWYRAEDLGHESWLDVNKLILSRAALTCGSYASALLFLETYRSDKKSKPRTIDLYDKNVQEIMYETYSNVEDPDGFYGVQNSDTWDALNRRLRHEGEHWRSFGLHSAALETGLSHESVGVMRDLHHLGFDQVSSSVFSSFQQSSGKSGNNVNEPLLFELAWRTSDWDLPVPSESSTSPASLLYSSLRAVHRERDMSVAQAVVGNAIDLQIGTLRDCGAESMTQIKKTVTDLICLNEVRKWLDPVTRADIDSRKKDSPALVHFISLNSAFPFADAERIMATRRSLIRASKEREKQAIFGDMFTPRLEMLWDLETKCLLRLGEMARNEGNIQAAINALVAVQKVERDRGTETDAVQDEFSQVLWAQGEHMLAIQHVESRIKSLKEYKKGSDSRSAILLSRLANWTAKAKLRASQDINETFEEAVRLSSAHKVSQSEQSQLCHDYALFADSHQAAVARSPELEKLTTYRERKEAELRSSTPIAPARKSGKGSAKTEMTTHLEREMKEDEAAISALVQERSSYAKTALKMYAKALALSDDHDDSTTRMCSLWLENDEDDDVNTAFADPLQQIPSHKFIFLSPQLAARLDRPKVLSPFNDVLNKLVLRISVEHPYHTLYQVITLAEGMSTGSKPRRTSDAGAEGRGPAAAAILATIASSKDIVHKMAKTASTDMQRLAAAATSWCLSRSKQEESVTIGKRINVPEDCSLRALQNLSIPIATAPPPIDPTGIYHHITTLARYRSTYAVLGGIHRPKKMAVVGSDGKEYAELFKGEDELRQDAVMEQVFEMSNKLLKRDRRTKTRNLKFRTYGVIPLARKTGIMEFVGNSQAIGDWLKPAHARYGKINDDIPADEFRKRLKPIQDKEKDWVKLPQVFTDLRANFHPVMRHFFTERHRDPMAWFTMRLNYTRSVAVTSMVGWMLGIGDRHCSNILIDQKSGELVHIDFGIVFEDGRRLRIPEKVPFRLTNDLVDGFGVTGVEGTFRRCSEHTLRVLRESSELIMTVLEVFKHDPLYAWDADPEKLQRAQGGGRVSAAGTSASALEKADRILSKIRVKLRDDLSVEYTVNQLIQEARDVDNLAKIFVGWQPWF